MVRDVPAETAKALLRNARHYKKRLDGDGQLSEKAKEDLQESIDYLEREAKGLYDRWIAPSGPRP